MNWLDMTSVVLTGLLNYKPKKKKIFVLAEAAETTHGAQGAIETSTIPPTPATVVAGGGEQTTLITNEEEAFALEPLDTTHMPGL